MAGDQHAPGPGEPFGSWVRARRTELLLTQEQLAEASGLSVRTVRNLEAGRGPAARLETRRLAIAALGGTATETRPAAPAQLPLDIPGFVGRSAPLREMAALLTERSGPLLITGPAGSGKTALAVHWAHRIRHLFPDGQLCADLRGFAPNAQPSRPLDVLARVLRTLGVAPEHMPTDLDEAVGAYRTLLADRSMLILLDNVREPDQVRPLLPGGSGNLVIVTSREHLGGLIARDGATRIGLGALSDRESLQLLGRIVGERRISAERDAADELVRLCARLPLALRIAATNAHDSDGLADYAGRLRGNALDELAVDGDRHSAVRGAFEVSYLALPSDARLLFRRLGLLPGPDFAAGTAAVLSATTVPAAAAGLRLLVRCHLIEERAGGRFGFHDLIGEYAHERAVTEESPAERDRLVASLYGHYLAAVAAAAQLLYPHLTRLSGEETGTQRPPAAQSQHFADPAEASAWLDAERAALVAAVTRAAADGPPGAAWRLADGLRGYFVSRMHTVDWAACAEAALAAAVADGDPHGQAASHLSLATLRSRLGDQAAAIDGYATCLDLSRRVGWTGGEVAALGSLGNAFVRQGMPLRAEAYFTEVLAHAQAAEQLPTQAAVLSNLGLISMELGHLDEAADRYARALDLAREVAAPGLAANALANLGEVNHALGLFATASELFAHALEEQQRIGDRDGEGFTHCHLAALRRDQGLFDEAQELAETARALAAAAGHRRYEIDADNILASIDLRRSQPALALRRLLAVLDAARQTGYRYAESVALTGIGEAQHRLGDPSAATATLLAAVDVAVEGRLRVPEASAHTTLAGLLLDLGDTGAAIETARRALAIWSETGHRFGEARARIVLGEALLADGQAVEARRESRRGEWMVSEIGAVWPRA